jgi:hypothetical protein
VIPQTICRAFYSAAALAASAFKRLIASSAAALAQQAQHQPERRPYGAGPVTAGASLPHRTVSPNSSLELTTVASALGFLR